MLCTMSFSLSWLVECLRKTLHSRATEGADWTQKTKAPLRGDSVAPQLSDRWHNTTWQRVGMWTGSTTKMTPLGVLKNTHLSQPSLLAQYLFPSIGTSSELWKSRGWICKHFITWKSLLPPIIGLKIRVSHLKTHPEHQMDQLDRSWITMDYMNNSTAQWLAAIFLMKNQLCFETFLHYAFAHGPHPTSALYKSPPHRDTMSRPSRFEGGTSSSHLEHY